MITPDPNSHSHPQFNRYRENNRSKFFVEKWQFSIASKYAARTIQTHAHTHTHTHTHTLSFQFYPRCYYPTTPETCNFQSLKNCHFRCCCPVAEGGMSWSGFCLVRQRTYTHPPPPPSTFSRGGGGMLVWCQKGAVRKRKLWPAFLRKGRFLRSFEFLKRIHFLLDLLLLLLSMYGPDFYIKHFSIPSDFLDYKCWPCNLGTLLPGESLFLGFLKEDFSLNNFSNIFILHTFFIVFGYFLVTS